MKVSRKVGRRSRSSVSRRRFRSNKNKKSGYKKRYAKTHKGGKRGRGQKRMRVHTHKRGRRFHRGGVGEWDETKWKDKEDDSSTKIGSGLLVYQKDILRSVTSQTKSFDVTLKKTSGLIEIPGQNGYPGEKFIRFKVTMERYKKGN